jgi:hypothetical protein
VKRCTEGADTPFGAFPVVAAAEYAVSRASAKEAHLSHGDGLDWVLVELEVPLLALKCGSHVSRAFVNIVKPSWNAAFDPSVLVGPPERSEQCTCPA